MVRETRAIGYPLVDDLAVILRAEQERRSGRPDRAMEMLVKILDGKELYQARVAMMHASADSGRFEDLLTHAKWLESNRGRAYIEFNGRYVLQSMNAVDSNAARLYKALALRELDRPAEAKKALAEFDAIWEPGTLPAYLRDLRTRAAL